MVRLCARALAGAASPSMWGVEDIPARSLSTGARLPVSFSVYISRTAPDAKWQYLRNPDRMPIKCPAYRCGIPERVPIDKFVQFIPVGVESTSFIGGIPYGYTPIPKHIKLGGVINMVIEKRALIQGISLPEVRNVEG